MALFVKNKQKRAQIVDRKHVETAKSREEELDELFVFGYAAKLFHDDEKAIYIDKGKHLIPWMGDTTLMIDRYDGRGHLHDLSEYDLDAWNREYRLSEEEARIEALCDEERYLALHTDLLEEQHRQEEELKRLNEAIAGSEDNYQAVGFSYDDAPSSSYNASYDPTQPTDDYEDDANKENQEEEDNPIGDDEEPFVAPKELELPSDMEVPATVKTNAIIERTAIFVMTNGPQFEIILKAKQSGNSQFNFLDFEHYLNKYYRHVLKYIKSGKYKPKSTDSKDTPENNHRKASCDDESSCHTDDEEESDADSSGYLHPSLLTSRKTKSPKKTDAPPWPSGTSLPTQSVITAVGTSSALLGPVYGPMLPGLPLPLLPPAASTTANSGTTTAPILPPPIPPFIGVAPDGSAVVPPPPQTVPPTTVHVNTLSSFTAAQPALSGISALTATPPPPPPEDNPSAVATTSASAQAIPTIVPPPPDLQPVIDKMAKYVAKNGVEFEATVRAKSDPRFEFLLPWHSYHAYYEYKKKLFIGEFGKKIEDEPEMHSKKARGPVSFSIKSKDSDDRVSESRCTFPVESSSDSDGENAGKSDEKYNPFMLPEMSSGEKQSDKKKPQLSLEELEARQAKQRLEDKLALAAREKLAQSSRERQLQLERKKKAAMFLSKLKGGGPASATATAMDITTSYEMLGSTASVTAPSAVSSSRTARSESPIHDNPVKFLPHSRSLSPIKRRSKSPPRSYRKSYRFHSQARSRSRSPKGHRSRSRSKSPKRRRHASPALPTQRPQTTDDNNRSHSQREVSSPSHHRSNRDYYRRSDDRDTEERTHLPPNINEDLRAKVRAMLAASRQTPTS